MTFCLPFFHHDKMQANDSFTIFWFAVIKSIKRDQRLVALFSQPSYACQMEQIYFFFNQCSCLRKLFSCSHFTHTTCVQLQLEAYFCASSRFSLFYAVQQWLCVVLWVLQKHDLHSALILNASCVDTRSFCAFHCRDCADIVQLRLKETVILMWLH